MRHYEKQISIPTEHNVLTKTTCDLCGAVAKYGGWGKSIYEVNEAEVSVEVRQKSGSTYPGGGWGTELVADICPTCFKETLIPFLREKGANIEEREWDW